MFVLQLMSSLPFQKKNLCQVANTPPPPPHPTAPPPRKKKVILHGNNMLKVFCKKIIFQALNGKI